MEFVGGWTKLIACSLEVMRFTAHMHTYLWWHLQNPPSLPRVWLALSENVLCYKERLLTKQISKNRASVRASERNVTRLYLERRDIKIMFSSQNTRMSETNMHLLVRDLVTNSNSKKKGNIVVLFFWMKVWQKDVGLFLKTLKTGLHSFWLAGEVCVCFWGCQTLKRTSKAQEKGSAPLECVSLPHYWYICTRLGVIRSTLHRVWRMSIFKAACGQARSSKE